MTYSSLLAKALQQNHLVLDAHQQQQLCDYLTLMHRWNKAYNLTSITDPEDMVYLHIIDSLLIHPHLKGAECLDVGTGAGLPGIPLAILNPAQQWTLLDKNNKKILFLNQILSELGLKNVKTVHTRIEDFHPSACFDSIVSRALSHLALFVETTAHLLCAEGQWLAMKGRYPAEELIDLPAHCLVQEVKPLTMLGREIERHIVCLSKMKK
ncbi:MAG TPA: 16S rRNA (guanine(527)-N(7))-methyltransferase RsmG [Gammaproteobacteria bacterium]|jgi:16S rRNA (guanine527-N7)-methyltransferase|nr:16S rRNA (guanine(527)-N(7))-methyltransferase RsmG [Gammaproteobacteria bacterium]